MAIKNYSDIITDKKTPQTEPLFGKKMAKNNAGGWSFEVDNWVRLQRFIVLGSSEGSYYVAERPLTIDNAKSVLKCIEEDGLRVVREVIEVSTKGRAPKQDPAIFVLALAAAKGNAETRAAAYEAMPYVCRTGTTLFKFVANSNALRGWGKGLRRAISNWYTSKTPDQLAYQVTKYQQRDGWSHRDVLRLAHTKTFDVDINAVLRWCVVGISDGGERSVNRKEHGTTVYPAVGIVPSLIQGMEDAKLADSKAQIVRLIQDYGLVREHIPTKWLNEPEVWEALLEKMPLGALLRNLGNLTKNGVIAPLSKGTVKVVEALSNRDSLKKARIHPISILIALKTYASGKGFKGSSTWQPNQKVVDALDSAFYSSFEFVRPTGKNLCIGLDVSGSMDWSFSDSPLTSREIVGALSLVLSATEPNVFVGAFSSTFVPINFGKRSRLDDVMKAMQRIPMGRTDCAVPIIHAMQNKMDVDAFIVMTDNESYCGAVHPTVALKEYRKKFNKLSKLAVLATTASSFSMADQTDAGQMDFCGFDASVPTVLADFIGGREEELPIAEEVE